MGFSFGFTADAAVCGPPNKNTIKKPAEASLSLPGVAGFEPTTYAAVKAPCLKPLGDTPIYLLWMRNLHYPLENYFAVSIHSHSAGKKPLLEKSSSSDLYPFLFLEGPLWKNCPTIVLRTSA